MSNKPNASAQLAVVRFQYLKSVREILSELTISDPSDFMHAIHAVLQTGIVSPGKLAEKLKVSLSTIDRWVRGQSCPHEIGRRAVQKQLIVILDEHIEELE